MKRLNVIISFLLLGALLAGCASPVSLGLTGAGVPRLQGDNILVSTATPTLGPEGFYQPPVDATATPTPFQPLPPTPVFLPTTTPTQIPPPMPTDTPTVVVPVPENFGDVGELPNQMTIMLLGSDKRPWGTGFRTDTIILATLNMDLGTVNLLSFPRDLYVDIPGWGQDRINTAWGHGGFKSLQATMQKNFGVKPDHYILIDFQSFKRFIDSLGGLEVKVQREVSDYRGGRWITIKKGRQYMNADLVLWYVRTRKTSNDFQRNQRQQEVLQAIFEKLLSVNAFLQIFELYDLYDETVSTSLTWDDIYPWLPLATKMVDSSHIKHFYVNPGMAYDWITYSGAMVLIPVKEKIRNQVRRALNSQ